MSYTIDKSNIENNILTLTDKSDSKYFVKLTEISEGSDVWTFSFIQPPNKISNNSFGYMFVLCREIFESDLLEKNKVSKILLLIEGDNREDADEKTEIFTKIINDDWDFKIEQDPETIIQDGGSYINFNKNSIYITKKEKVLENIVVVGIMKFCPNCGLENNNYKFCPSCGTNLKQA
jgi:hypothetical protein